MSDSVRPHRQQPTRLPRPWDSPGKSTGVGCHFLLQCMKVKSEREVAQPCLTLSDPMDCTLPGCSIHGIFQTRVLEWRAIAFSDYLLYVTPNSYTVPHMYTMFAQRWYYSLEAWTASWVFLTLPMAPTSHLRGKNEPTWYRLLYRMNKEVLKHRPVQTCIPCPWPACISGGETKHRKTLLL